jgi:hypothetical protein
MILQGRLELAQCMSHTFHKQGRRAKLHLLGRLLHGRGSKCISIHQEECPHLPPTPPPTCPQGSESSIIHNSVRMPTSLYCTVVLAKIAAANASDWPQQMTKSVSGSTSRPWSRFIVLARMSQIPCTCLRAAAVSRGRVEVEREHSTLMTEH